MTRRKTKTISSEEVNIQISEAFEKEETNASLVVIDIPAIPAIPVLPDENSEQLKYLNALAKEEIKDKKAKRSRENKQGNAHVGMSSRAFWLSAAWCFFVAVVIVLVGAGVLVLSEGMVIALIASVALSPIIKALSGWFKSGNKE